MSYQVVVDLSLLSESITHVFIHVYALSERQQFEIELDHNMRQRVTFYPKSLQKMGCGTRELIV